MEVCTRLPTIGYTRWVIIATKRTRPDGVNASLNASLNAFAGGFLMEPFGVAEVWARVSDVLGRTGTSDHPSTSTW